MSLTRLGMPSLGLAAQWPDTFARWHSTDNNQGLGGSRIAAIVTPVAYRLRVDQDNAAVSVRGFVDLLPVDYASDSCDVVLAVAVDLGPDQFTVSEPIARWSQRPSVTELDAVLAAHGWVRTSEWREDPDRDQIRRTLAMKGRRMAVPYLTTIVARQRESGATSL